MGSVQEVGEGWQKIIVFQTLIWICLTFKSSPVPSLGCSDRFELSAMGLHYVPLTTYLKQGFSLWSMRRITWKAWQCPDCWAPPSEIQIQWVWSGLEGWYFWQFPRWCCCCCWSGHHTLGSSGTKKVPSIITFTSSPLTQTEYVWIRISQCDCFSFWA